MDDIRGVDDVLSRLLRHKEILGAVAVSAEGLVIGCAGVSDDDAETAGALGATLVGSTDRTIRRMGAGTPVFISIATTQGMIHVRPFGDFALIIFSEETNGLAVGDACQQAIRQIAGMLQPVA